MCSGREFQVWAAATGKARLPTVASLTGGTTRRLVPAERRALRPGTSTVEVSGPRYRCALPWRTLYVSTLLSPFLSHVFYLLRCCLLSSPPLRSLPWERCKLSQQGPGQIPGHKRILVGLRPELVNRDWMQQFWSFTSKQ